MIRYRQLMRRLRFFLTLLTILSLLAGHLTAASVVLAELSPAPASAPNLAGEQHTPSCADCGREATAPAACIAGCLMPPADLTRGVAAIPAFDADCPTELCLATLVGRTIRPDLQPPQAL